VCMSECDDKASIMRGPLPARGCCSVEKQVVHYYAICSVYCVIFSKPTKEPSIYSSSINPFYHLLREVQCLNPHPFMNNMLMLAVPWLRRLVAGLPRRKPGFDPGSVHVGFLVDEVALGQVFPRVLRFSPVNFIPPVLHY
jgi:hypothetical protein